MLPAARVLSSGYRATGITRRCSTPGSDTSPVRARATSPAFDSFGEALLWAVAIVVAQQGDPVPTSTGAHVVMLAGFGCGLAVIATLAGALGAHLVEARGERGRERGEPPAGAPADAPAAPARPDQGTVSVRR